VVLIVRGCQGQAQFSLSFARWISGTLDLLLKSSVEIAGCWILNYFLFLDIVIEGICI
jgi:hypothetical protein